MSIKKGLVLRRYYCRTLSASFRRSLGGEVKNYDGHIMVLADDVGELVDR